MKNVWIASLALWLVGLAPVVSASTVVDLSFEEVVAGSALVFEGEVVAVESRRTGPRRIHTFVRFRVLDVIRGAHEGAELELRYLGGEVDGRRMQVTDMDVPAVGETGVYFVESPDRPLVHPLTGWSQGHYRTRPDGQGERRVYTAGRRAVTGLAEADSESVQRPATQSSHAAAAGGLQVQALESSVEGMPVSRFKSLIREVAGEASGTP